MVGGGSGIVAGNVGGGRCLGGKCVHFLAALEVSTVSVCGEVSSGMVGDGVSLGVVDGVGVIDLGGFWGDAVVGLGDGIRLGGEHGVSIVGVDFTRRHFIGVGMRGDLIEQGCTYFLSSSLLSLLGLEFSFAFWSCCGD